MNRLDIMGSPKPCFIWPDTEARWSSGRDDKIYVEHSPHAGGKYVITDSARFHLEDQGLAKDHRARLTTWLVKQRQLGVDFPEVTVSVIEQAKRAKPLPVAERADKLLRHISDQLASVGSYSYFSEDDFGLLICSESLALGDVLYLIEYLEHEGWLEYGPNKRTQLELRITVPGHSRIEELQTNADSSQAFVAMWFDDSMDEVYEMGIEPAIRDAGYEPRLIKLKPHINKIDDEIIAEIRRSRFIVADFSHGEDGARGSVYFEAGFALGLGLPVFFSCRDHKDHVLHLDTRQYHHTMWKTPAELRKDLYHKIRSILGEGPEPAQPQ